MWDQRILKQHFVLNILGIAQYKFSKKCKIFYRIHTRGGLEDFLHFLWRFHKEIFTFTTYVKQIIFKKERRFLRSYIFQKLHRVIAKSIVPMSYI